MSAVRSPKCTVQNLLLAVLLPWILPWFSHRIFTSAFYVRCDLGFYNLFSSRLSPKSVSMFLQQLSILFYVLKRQKTPSMIILIVLFFVCFSVFFLARNRATAKDTKKPGQKQMKSPSQNQERSPGFFEFSMKDVWTLFVSAVVFLTRYPEVNGGEEEKTKNKPDDKVRSIGEDIITLPEVAGQTNWLIWLCHMATFRLHSLSPCHPGVVTKQKFTGTGKEAQSLMWDT